MTIREMSTLLLLACVVGSGCSSRKLTDDYGVRQFPGSHQSVNGTTALARMFELAGHKVTSWRYLSPRLREKADCIVWFPDHFDPPEADVRAWLEDWLLDKPGRTLIYVGRDYDTATAYWRRMNRGAPAEQAQPLAQQLSDAQRRFDQLRGTLLTEEDGDWFTLKGSRQLRAIRTLEGESRWLEGVDPAKLEIELVSRLVPPPTAEVLLSSEGDMLVARETWGESQLIVVANGSFLLNLPLVNREHRKLAARLIADVGPAKNVYFLESGRVWPVILDEDPEQGLPTGLEVFTIYPFNQILLHLALVGVFFGFARYWIFGIPREDHVEHESDFGAHVTALGKLLEKTRDAEYARERLAHYRLASRGEAAAAPTSSASAPPPGKAPLAVGSGAQRTSITETTEGTGKLE
jgi:hypothetical protein